MKSGAYFLTAMVLACVAASPGWGYTLTFQPRISMGVEYTDNVFLAPGGGVNAAGRAIRGPVSDFMFVPAPGFTAEMLGREKGASLSYDFGYSYYNKYSEKNSWRHNASLSAWTQFARDKRLDVRNAFLYTEDPLGQNAFQVTAPVGGVTPPDQTTLRSRQPYWVNTADMRYTQQFGKRDSYFLEFNNSIRNDDDPLGNSSVQYTPGAGMSYWFNARWGVDLEGAYNWGNYDNAPDISQWHTTLRVKRRLSRQLELFGEGTYRMVDQKGNLQDFLRTTRRTLEDYKVYDLRLGTTYSISRHFALEASGGVVYYKPDITEDLTRFSGTFNLTRTFQRGSARLYGGSGYGQAFDTRSDLGPSQFYEAGVSGNYQLARLWTLDGFFSFRRDEYSKDQRLLLAGALAPGEVGPLPEAALNRDDNNYGAGLGLIYAMRPWISFKLQYRYRKVDSTLEVNSYDENRATFYVNLTTPRPFRTER